MSGTDHTPEADTAGIARTLRAFLAACAQYASARLRLVSMEGKEAAFEVAKLLLIIGTALIMGMFGWLFVCLAVVFLLAPAMGEHGWIWASLTMAAAHIAVAGALAIFMRTRVGREFFPLTTSEFEKDRVWLEREEP